MITNNQREEKTLAICNHISIKRKTLGQESECLNCKLPIIFTGEKWEWQYSMIPKKLSDLRTHFWLNRDKP